MYVCDSCKKSTSGRCFILSQALRAKQYPERKYTNRRGVEVHDPGGQGAEWTGQWQLCESCLREEVDRTTPPRAHRV